MAIEMKIYKEIGGYEAKAMFGRTWRQLASLAVMIFVGGGLFAAITFGLLAVGQSLEQATNVAMYSTFPVLIPAAAWGWWRPQGLKPEQYLGFFLRFHLMKRQIRYEDTYRLERVGEPVPAADAAPLEPAQRAHRGGDASAIRALRKDITEHPQGPDASRAARRADARARKSRRR